MKTESCDSNKLRKPVSKVCRHISFESLNNVLYFVRLNQRDSVQIFIKVRNLILFPALCQKMLHNINNSLCFFVFVEVYEHLPFFFCLPDWY